MIVEMLVSNVRSLDQIRVLRPIMREDAKQSVLQADPRDWKPLLTTFS
jgi:hypothetical protein